jgi:hypothetical protein
LRLDLADWVALSLRPSDASVDVTDARNRRVDKGQKVVWLIDRRERIARVYSAIGTSSLVRADQPRDGGAVLSVFILPLSDCLTAASGRGSADRRAPSARIIAGHSAVSHNAVGQARSARGRGLHGMPNFRAWR